MHSRTTTTGYGTMPNPLRASPLLFLVLAITLFSAPYVQAFSSPSRPPSPHSPYDRRPPPSTPPPSTPATDATEDRGSNLYRPFNPVLGPGSRVAIAGADAPGESRTLTALITKKLFKNQMRPYLLVPSMEKVPTGLGFDQYKGLTRYICTQPVDERKDGDGKISSEIDGLVLCSEKGYTAKQVRALLARVEKVEEEDGRGGGGGTGEKKGLKRVVMLSSLGVNRREDVMWKLRQFGVHLEQRYQAEQELISQAQRRGFSYTLIRVGPLRGGGGEEGLGYEFYDQHHNSNFQKMLQNPLSFVLAKRDEHFDSTQRGFTFSYEDNFVFGETGRILAAETMIKALGSAHVEDVAISLVSEQGRTWPNFQVAPWDLF